MSILVSLFAVLLCGCGQETQKHNGQMAIGIIIEQTEVGSVLRKAITDMISYAIEEVNQQGGVLSKQLSFEVLSLDQIGKNTRLGEIKEFAQKTEIQALFYYGSIETRMELQDFVQEVNKPIFYPLDYEGSSDAHPFTCTGPDLNQKVIPPISWAFKNIGQRFFLVGDRSTYSQLAHLVIKEYVQVLGGEVVGEALVQDTGNAGMASIAENIKNSHPHVIINNIRGPSNLPFFIALRASDIHPEDIPTFSLRLSENDYRQLETIPMQGDYVTASYLQSLQTPKNLAFQQSFHQKYGKGRPIDEVMETTYSSLWLWVNAVNEAQSTTRSNVLKSISFLKFDGPGGVMAINSDASGAYRMSYVGLISGRNQFKVVYKSTVAIPPKDEPLFYSKQAWTAVVQEIKKNS